MCVERGGGSILLFTQHEDLADKDVYIYEALVENVVPRCGCDFSEDHITNRVFQCFSTSPQSVTYYTQLHSTLNANASELIRDIEDWVSTGVTIPVLFLLLTVSSVCEVDSNIPVENCPGDETPTDLEATTSSGTFNIITPIIIATSILIALTITAVALVFIVYIRYRHRVAKMDLQVANKQ